MDFNNYLEQLNLSSNTKKSYNQSYTKLQNSGLFHRGIETTGEEAIISNIEKITDNPNTAASLLNICILIKRHYGKPSQTLMNYRDKLKSIIEKHHDEIHKNLQLPTYEDLIKYVDDSYKKKEYLTFIVNYLLVNYGVRNKDLDCLIVRNKNSITNSDNYLVVMKSQILWIRNIYKTAGKYGRKQITIKNRKFMNAITSLERNDGEPLLLNASRERIREGSLGFFIQNMTLDNIGEGNIAKILLQHYNGHYNKLIEFSQNRGTNLDTLLNRYNITN